MNISSSVSDLRNNFDSEIYSKLIEAEQEAKSTDRQTIHLRRCTKGHAGDDSVIRGTVLVIST